MKPYACKYFPCESRKDPKRNCDDYENCQVYKFYEKYEDLTVRGESQLELGLGATHSEDVRRVYNES